jgi:hypothetical protein
MKPNALREFSEIIKILNRLKFKFVGLDNYAGGDQTLSYAKDGIQIDITTPEGTIVRARHGVCRPGRGMALGVGRSALGGERGALAVGLVWPGAQDRPSWVHASEGRATAQRESSESGRTFDNASCKEHYLARALLA